MRKALLIALIPGGLLVLGCLAVTAWLGRCRHDWSRPWTIEGRSYQVCTRCGHERDFDATAWAAARV